MKKGQFFKGLSWLVLLNLLIKPVWIFLIDRTVQNRVGHEAYGNYFALFNLSYVLLFAADAGLTNMMVQRIAAHPKQPTKEYAYTKLLLLALYGVLCLLTGVLFGISDWKIFLYLVILQAFGSLLLFLRGLLTANQLFKTDAFFSVADKTFLILTCAVFLFVWWQPITIERFLLLQITTTAVSLVLLLLTIQRKHFITQGEKEPTGVLIKRFIPFGTIILLMGLHYRADGFLLERLRSDGNLQAGIYATAYRLLDAGNMLGYLTASFLVPFVARNKADTPLTSTVVRLTRHILLAAGMFASCFSIVFAAWLQQLLYHTGFSFNTNVIQLSMAVLPAYYLVHIYGSVLTATGKLKAFIRMLLVSVIINLALNVLLIPAYGAVGCSLAALASQYACAIGCYFIATKKCSLSDSFGAWIAYMIGAGVLFLVLLTLRSFISSVWLILACLLLLVITVAITQQKNVKLIFHSFK